MKELLTVCNLADHNTKVDLMKAAIETLSKNPDMGIVVAQLICTSHLSKECRFIVISDKLY
jgi:hypothetical protein